MTTLLIIAIFIFAVAASIPKDSKYKKPKPLSNQQTRTEYFRKIPISEPEQTLYYRLTQALPDRVILAQVAMLAFIGIRRQAEHIEDFNRISRKYVDFVICRKDFQIEAVVELDDASHKAANRIQADIDKEMAIRQAGIPVIRFHVRDMPTIERIQQEVWKHRGRGHHVT